MRMLREEMVNVLVEAWLLNPARGLTRPLGFRGQLGSTRINPEKLKKNKVLIFHMKKFM